MNRTGAALIVIAALSLAGGCASPGPSPLPEGPAAYEAIPEHAVREQQDMIGPGDKLAIKVLGEPELSSDGYVVESSGYVQIPLLGDVIAAGQTSRELAADLARRLGSKFIRNPSVTVAIVDRPMSTYTVEGDVTAPGVYPATEATTLLTAMAQAKSPTKTAKTGDILVFRTINGQRAGGRFNLGDIRRGRAPDPQILPGDTVVVVNSAAKTAWRDFLTAVPVFNIFLFLQNN